LQDKENPDKTEDLIDLLYSMAVAPHRFQTMTNSFNTHVNDMFAAQAGEASRLPKQLRDFEDLTPHFQRAFDLIDQQGRNFNTATGSAKYIDADNNPAALISKTGTIIYANKLAEDVLGFTQGKKPDRDSFSPGQYDEMLRHLRRIDKFEAEKLISVCTLFPDDADQPVKMALTKTHDYDDNAIGRLSTFQIKWLAQTGQAFGGKFDLTHIEIAITRAIVLGIGLKGLAKSRGRSIETVRKQTKILLAKLDLHSQAELICLYSGFSLFNSHNAYAGPETSHHGEQTRKSHDLGLENGRSLHYELAGPADGRPVLFSHGLFGGMALSADAYHELKIRKIQLIMLWRPGFGETSKAGHNIDTPLQFAHDAEALLDHLKIPSCQCLSVISGSIFSYACAQYLGSRVIGIVNCGGVIPLTSRRQFEKMKPNQRTGMIMARYLPALLPLMMRGGFAKVDAGYDEEFMQEFYKDAPPDRMIVVREDLKRPFREAYSVGLIQGHMSLIDEMKLVAGRWQHYLENIKCPVSLIHGEQDPAFPVAIVQNFAETRDNFEVTPVKEAGELVYFQYPEIAFRALDSQLH